MLGMESANLIGVFVVSVAYFKELLGDKPEVFLLSVLEMSVHAQLHASIGELFRFEICPVL